MKPNTLKRIDNTFGRLLLVVLRPLVFCIDKIGERRKTPASPRKISFLKILGGGSLLIAYPAILGIRRRYPDAHLVLICAKEVKAYADLTDLFDETVQIGTGTLWQILLSSLRALRASFGSDIFVNYELHSKLSAIFVSLTISKERYGLYQDWNRWQERYINHPIFYNSATPIYVGYEQIARKIGGHDVAWSDACRHFQSHLRYQRVTSDSTPTRIGIAAYCSDLYKERQFSNAMFAKVIARHVTDAGSEVVLLGGPNDRTPAGDLAKMLARSLPAAHINNMAGKTSLRDVVSQFQTMSVLISIDSGLNHIARLLELPTVTYWGPSDPKLRLKSVNPAYETVFYHKIACSPCVHLIDVPPCAGRNICMQQFVEPELAETSNEGWEI